jgi:superfamily II DNA or RNA helicase
VNLQNRITVILGQKGCGKTSLAAEAADRAFLTGQRVIVIAPMGFAGKKGRHVLAGVPVIRKAEPARFENLKGRSALILPDNDELAIMAFKFCWFLQENNPEPLLIVVDEVHKYLSWKRPDETLLQIISYGRHRRINLIATSQRPAQVHNDLLAQADVRVIFRTTEVNDLAYLKRFAGADPDRLQSLEKFQFLVL